ncbi:MAG: aminotransferase class III-fold pyridoxal phosphate-dependent enzyme [Nevskiaceae bacterium]|nr:MAG: aminotransferase class III-fold pyridoxal phosphate-dependent enzyme [Nevskiaceae bacterium]
MNDSSTARYENSVKWLERAERTIPLGSQTFSKSRTSFPVGVSPLFLTRGQGSKVWDVDGNRYIDFINGLLAVSLGYGDPDVDAAVTRQLASGVSFSLPHTLEAEVAERIVDRVPCAEQVRFGKNGSDATAGAVRIARAYTGCDRVAVCGYHGWQDWYIGSTTRDLGVPAATKELTHKFVYNDIDSLQRLFDEHPGQFAAVIMEPMNVVWPAPGFLEAVRDRAHAHGALLIFDETITGFRYARGGAQELFGITPDLATFGKGVANGFPLSIVVGRREYMKLMEEIFFSFTFGGEALSLAATRAVLDKMDSHGVLQSIHRQGQKVLDDVAAVVARHGLDQVFRLSGHPSWSFLNVADTARYSQFEIKTFLLQEMFARGILMLGTHNISYAHDDEDIRALTTAYDEVLAKLSLALAKENLTEQLHCKVLTPLFKVR